MALKLIKNTISVINTSVKHIKEDIHAVFDRDPAARNALEVLLTYPGLHALLLHRTAHFCWEHEQKFVARGIGYASRMLTGIEIHPAAKIGRRFFIDHGMGVVIGETAEIGDDVTLYHGVTLGGVSWQKGKRHPTLEDGVVVGAGAKVLGPFTVGKNAKIGSNTVVVKPVPENATMVGTPARMVNKQASTTDSMRHALAKAMGFSAYGEIPNSPDPVVAGFKQLLDHLQTTDDQISTIKQALCKLDPSFCAGDYNSLSPKDIDLLDANDKLNKRLKQALNND